MKKLYKYGILLVLPFLLFFLSRLTNRSFGEFYLSCIDPEYTYLFNGLCVAELKLDLGHYHHPGNPLQCMIAITSIIANIASKDLTLPENIFLNPEYYLHASNFAINLINLLFIFMIGYLVYRRSRNIILALFIQASPFASIPVLVSMGRVIPESLLGVAGLMLLLLVFYFSTREDPKYNMHRYIILFSLISGYGLALKLTYIPLIIIPLVIIPSFINRLKYILYTVISFFIFAFPLLGKLDNFWRWTKNLFIHSGQFGTGEPNIVNIQDFTANIKLLINGDKILFALLLLFILIIIIYFIRPLKLKIQNDNLHKALIGLVLAIIIQYTIVAKHYKFAYMIPILCFSFFGIFLSMEILSRPFQKYRPASIFKNILYLSIIIFTVIHSYYKLMDKNLIRRQEVEKREQTLEFINNNLKEKCVLLVPWYYGSAYVERGLVEGLFYSGRYKREYSKILEKYYPNTYFYLPWHNRYYDWSLKWDNGLSPEKLISRNKDIYIYFGIKDTRIMNKVFNDLKSCCPENYTEPVKIYSNNDTGESIYRFL